MVEVALPKSIPTNWNTAKFRVFCEKPLSSIFEGDIVEFFIVLQFPADYIRADRARGNGFNLETILYFNAPFDGDLAVSFNESVVQFAKVSPPKIARKANDSDSFTATWENISLLQDQGTAINTFWDTYDRICSLDIVSELIGNIPELKSKPGVHHVKFDRLATRGVNFIADPCLPNTVFQYATDIKEIINALIFEANIIGEQMDEGIWNVGSNDFLSMPLIDFDRDKTEV